MTSERLVMGIATVILAVISIVVYRDYLTQSAEAYDARDAAKAQVASLEKQLTEVDNFDDFDSLSDKKLVADEEYTSANRRINDIDGWNSPEWKAKNTVRFAAPAAMALFGAFTLLSILSPLRRDG